MSDAESGQVNAAVAQAYEDFFVPALFAKPAKLAVEVAQLREGQRDTFRRCRRGCILIFAVGRWRI